jgi:hypothetical protein
MKARKRSETPGDAERITSLFREFFAADAEDESLLPTVVSVGGRNEGKQDREQRHDKEN